MTVGKAEPHGATPALVRGFKGHHREGRTDPQALLRMRLQEAATGMIHRRLKCVTDVGLHVIKYLRGAVDYGLAYPGKGEVKRLNLFADASFGPADKGYAPWGVGPARRARQPFIAQSAPPAHGPA